MVCVLSDCALNLQLANRSDYWKYELNIGEKKPLRVCTSFVDHQVSSYP